MIWNILYPVSLRSRLYAILTSLVLLTVMGGLVMVWYTYRIDRLLGTIIERNMAAYQAAEALETALVNQKGFVSYYFLDGDPDWLRQLGEYRIRIARYIFPGPCPVLYCRYIVYTR